MTPTLKEKDNASMAFLTYKNENYPVNDKTVFVIAQDINVALAEGYGSLPAGGWQVIWGPALVTTDMMEKKQANLTFVAQSTSNRSSYIVASRGTVGSDLLEWLNEDLPVSLVNWPMPYDVPSTPKVSRATANALKIVLNAVPPTNTPNGYSPLPGAGQYVADFLANLTNDGPIEICFTGHSLGGAISPALALWFRQTQGNANIPGNDIFSPMPSWDPDVKATISCVSFAGATPGDILLRNYFAKLMGNSYDRIYNTYDIVPYAFSNLDALPALYGDVAKWTEGETLFLDAIKLDVAAAEYKAGSKYATLPSDNQFTGELQSDQTSYLEQAAYQHSQAYATLFGVEIAKD